VIGILLGLLQRKARSQGMIIDASMTDGTAYLSSFLFTTKQRTSLWLGEKGTNLLDSGAPFYEVYKTQDGKYIAV
jgi:alpha-methylacyl-CoA racemase